jgi:hypothetical protein
VLFKSLETGTDMKIDWRTGILYISAIGMEGCWLYALASFLNKQSAGEALSIFGLLIFYPLSFGFNRLLVRAPLHRVYIVIIGWMAWLLAMLFAVKLQLYPALPLSDLTWLLAVPIAFADILGTFRPELLILASTAVLWWLGQRMAYLELGFNALFGEFQFGLAILTGALLLAALLGIDIAHPVYITVFFFVFALTGVSVAHAMGGSSWLSGLYRGQWFGLLLVIISLVLILGLVISSLVSPELLQLALSALRWIWGIIVQVIAFLVSLLPQPEPQPLPEMRGGAPMPGGGGGETFSWSLPEVVRSGMRIGVGILFAGMVLIALWQVSSQIFAWLRRKLADMAGAEYEPVPNTFMEDVIEFFKSMIRKLSALGLIFEIRKRRQFVPPGASTVRQVYRQLLRWAADRGYKRHISQTPGEFSKTLATLLPDVRKELDFITGQYVRVRYGFSLPDSNELSQVNESWSRVKSKRIKRQRPGQV